MNHGDTILKNDTNYLIPDGGIQQKKKYIVYPSADVPRFIIPTSDFAAQKFILNMMSANTGYLGKTVRALLKIPGGIFLLGFVVFRNRIRIPHD